MHMLREDMAEFQKQLRNGSIQRAYRALLAYMMSLRTHFSSSHPDSIVSGLYQGYMDMTYFAVSPPSLKRHDLKIAIVFNYEAFRFEAWLAGNNRKVQRQVWELFKDSQWTDYRVVTPAPGIDSILECDLAKDFDFSDPDGLTSIIEAATAAFTDDIEAFLGESMEHDSGHFTTIDEYIATCAEAVRPMLRELRATIKAAAPDAQEKISYQMPTFALRGNLVHFAAFPRHIGFYPGSSGIAAFAAELAVYKGGKGSVQFPLDQPLPLELVSRIVEHRVAENLGKATRKAGTRKQ